MQVTLNREEVLSIIREHIEDLFPHHYHVIVAKFETYNAGVILDVSANPSKDYNQEIS